ncbi:hypothetical protein [Actinoplanes sp. CA-252034]|uniref:hypothetical protein n=1 Tax=Actinoplanes sp. CA-252034 TaxID=3239906 RepID=UPI003D96DF18
MLRDPAWLDAGQSTGIILGGLLLGVVLDTVLVPVPRPSAAPGPGSSIAAGTRHHPRDSRRPLALLGII